MKQTSSSARGLRGGAEAAGTTVVDSVRAVLNEDNLATFVTRDNNMPNQSRPMASFLSSFTILKQS
eukprot:m.255773 g.255773  ORF g.255773 m.255773 type:complete len:66 (-) comp15948_c0_seq5:5876-6073(-)